MNRMVMELCVLREAHPLRAGRWLSMRCWCKAVTLPERGKDHKLVVLLQVLPETCRLLYTSSPCPEEVLVRCSLPCACAGSESVKQRRQRGTCMSACHICSDRC